MTDTCRHCGGEIERGEYDRWLSTDPDDALWCPVLDRKRAHEPSDPVQYWTDRFIYFDFWTHYSDDHSVWMRGEEAKGRLRREIAEAALTNEQKSDILAAVGVRADASYLASREKHGRTVAERPLWDEGEGPELKRIVRGYLGMGS